MGLGANFLKRTTRTHDGPACQIYVEIGRAASHPAQVEDLWTNIKTYVGTLYIYPDRSVENKSVRYLAQSQVAQRLPACTSC